MKLKSLWQNCPCLPVLVGVACVSRLGFAAPAVGPPAASPPSPTNVVLTLEDALHLALDSNPELRASATN